MSEPDPITRHDLYELCVQSPPELSKFLRAVHGGSPTVLGEDFAGTTALSRRWVRDDPNASAIAVDLDGDALRYHDPIDRITLHAADVRAIDTPCDVLFVGNFSIGYWHTRADLVAYLKHARSRVKPGGVFGCDTYGGESSFLPGVVHRDHWIAGPDAPEKLKPHLGKRVRYTWEQRHADPLTARVTDALHFRVEQSGRIEAEFDDAFTYEWRLWSVPELRDAMLEAGFASVEVYSKLADAVDGEGNTYVRPVEDAEEELEESFIVFAVGRA